MNVSPRLIPFACVVLDFFRYPELKCVKEMRSLYIDFCHITLENSFTLIKIVNFILIVRVTFAFTCTERGAIPARV